MLLCHDFADGIRNIVIFRKILLQNRGVLNCHIAVAVHIRRVKVNSFKRFHIGFIALNGRNVIDVHHTVAVRVTEKGVFEENIRNVLRLGYFR